MALLLVALQLPVHRKSRCLHNICMYVINTVRKVVICSPVGQADGHLNLNFTPELECDGEQRCEPLRSPGCFLRIGNLMQHYSSFSLKIVGEFIQGSIGYRTAVETNDAGIHLLNLGKCSSVNVWISEEPE